MAAEFVIGFVQRSIAAPANVSAGILQVRILAYEGSLSALLQDHVFLEVGQLVVFGRGW